MRSCACYNMTMRKLCRVLGGVILGGGLTVAAGSHTVGTTWQKAGDLSLDQIFEAPTEKQRELAWQSFDQSQVHFKRWDNLFWAALLNVAVGAGIIYAARRRSLEA